MKARVIHEEEHLVKRIRGKKGPYMKVTYHGMRIMPTGKLVEEIMMMNIEADAENEWASPKYHTAPVNINHGIEYAQEDSVEHQPEKIIPTLLSRRNTGYE